jgi:hypothetical protein
MTTSTNQPFDVMAVLAGMQDQIDDLTATVAAQQSAIEALRSLTRFPGYLF